MKELLGILLQCTLAIISSMLFFGLLIILAPFVTIFLFGLMILGLYDMIKWWIRDIFSQQN